MPSEEGKAASTGWWYTLKERQADQQVEPIARSNQLVSCKTLPGHSRLPFQVEGKKMEWM
jgi:hypothetical protein